MNFFDWLKSLICPKNPEVERLQKELNDAQTGLLKYAAQVNGLKTSYALIEGKYELCMQTMDASKTETQKQIEELSAEKMSLIGQIEEQKKIIESLQKEKITLPLSILPDATRQILENYWNKYREAEIFYSGRWLGSKKKKYDMDVKVFGLEGQNNLLIRQRVKNANAFVSDIMKNQNLEFHKACDVAVMRVTNAFPVNYVFDNTSWESSEFWQYPSETEAFRQGDCDDLMIWRYVGCRVAGIPEQMLRMAAGTTFDGQGHATNYYFASDLTWRHINSTSNYSASQDVKKLAKTHEPEALNLKSVWFSFTENKTWHDLSTEAMDSLTTKKAEKLIKNFRIRPKR